MDGSAPDRFHPAEASRSESSTLPSGGAVRGIELPSELSPPRIPDHEMIRRIGAGAYGEVWLARNATGSFRAVKIVHRSSFDSERPYQREFEGIKRFEPISHARESQVDIFHVGINSDAGYFYYIMELADDAGTALREDGGSKIENGGGAQIEPLHPPSSIFNPPDYIPRTLKHDLKTRGALPFDESVRLALPREIR